MLDMNIYNGFNTIISNGKEYESNKLRNIISSFFNINSRVDNYLLSIGGFSSTFANEINSSLAILTKDNKKISKSIFELDNKYNLLQKDAYFIAIKNTIDNNNKKSLSMLLEHYKLSFKDFYEIICYCIQTKNYKMNNFLLSKYCNQNTKEQMYRFLIKINLFSQTVKDNNFELFKNILKDNTKTFIKNNIAELKNVLNQLSTLLIRTKENKNVKDFNKIESYLKNIENNKKIIFPCFL